MNYALNKPAAERTQNNGILNALKNIWPLMTDEKMNLIRAFIVILINSALNLVYPVIIGYTVDHYIQNKDFGGVLLYSGVLLVLYLFGLVTQYLQTKLMGSIGQRVLFSLRNGIFNKLQSLPIAFFTQNKAGDLISRINNDTDKLNQFLSQSLMQFLSNIFMMVGAGIFLISLDVRLGISSLLPAAALLIFTQAISGWVKRKNATSLKSVGGMSAEIQESLDNFKVIVAFNRRDYFREKFAEANEQNYKTALTAGIANNIFLPVFKFFSQAAQLIVLAYGIYLISVGEFTLGLLISFLLYLTRFYDPLGQIASLWTSFQVALAGWDRIHDILVLESNLTVLPESGVKKDSDALLEFDHVSFSYPDGKEVLHHISFSLEKGKKYALVGPTGGGKTTTASLMARLYDPTKGTVFLNGKDIRSYTEQERAQKIGFILQEPFLFGGTLRDNILYGNEQYHDFTTEQLEEVLKNANLTDLLERFEGGLENQIVGSGDTMSLGQKQLIAFIRAVLRNPELLILDEATANIDTVTEQLLEEILKKLPAETTLVIIAHRLNTIANADEIYFVNAGEVTLAGSMEHALDMLLKGKRES